MLCPCGSTVKIRCRYQPQKINLTWRTIISLQFAVQCESPTIPSNASEHMQAFSPIMHEFCSIFLPDSTSLLDTDVDMRDSKLVKAGGALAWPCIAYSRIIVSL